MEQMTLPPRRLAVAITGASGAIYGERMLRALLDVGNVQVHLIVSSSGWRTIEHELEKTAKEICAMADRVHEAGNVASGIASGCFACDAMVIAPCSMRTLAAVAQGVSDNLIMRTADVMLKERRRLVLLARESPLHLVHLRNMMAVTEMGAIVCPPVPDFYAKPRSIVQIVDHTIAHVLDLLAVPHQLGERGNES